MAYSTCVSSGCRLRYHSADISPRRVIAEVWRTDERIQQAISPWYPRGEARQMAQQLRLNRDDSVRVRGVRLAELDGDLRSNGVAPVNTEAAAGRCNALLVRFLGTPEHAGASSARTSSWPMRGRRRAAAHGFFRAIRRRRAHERAFASGAARVPKQKLDKYRTRDTNCAPPQSHARTSADDRNGHAGAGLPRFRAGRSKPPIKPGDTKIVDLRGTGPATVRSNDASAIMAYWNVLQFFYRLQAYGLAAN